MEEYLMQSLAAQLDTPTLRKYEPLNSLNDHQLSQLMRCAVMHRLQPGEELTLKLSERQPEAYIDYLISGDIELLCGHNHQQLSAHHPQATQPLSSRLLNYTSIVAHTSCAILRVEKQLLESSLELQTDRVVDCEELHIEADMHSMTQILQNRCLLALPPENIETVMALMETVNFIAGEYVIHQGEQDDSYYTILNGRCRVTRQAHQRAKGIVLAELGAGASFGEEALIAGTPRNANIQMITDGSLMRLEKKYFLKYVVNPLTKFVNYRLMIERLRNGAKLIDVRNIDEYKRNGHGLNIPLPMLRLRLEKLSKNREYIFCCNDGKLSKTAAFIAKQQGFTSAILKSGLEMVPAEYLRRSQKIQH